MQQGDTVSYVMEYDDRKGKYKAVTSSCGGGLRRGDDVFIHCKQQVETEGLQQGHTVSHDTEYVGKYRASNCIVASSGWRGGEKHRTVDVASPQTREWIVDVPVYDATVDATMPSLRILVLEAEAEALHGDMVGGSTYQTEETAAIVSSAGLLNDTLHSDCSRFFFFVNAQNLTRASDSCL